MALQVCNRVKKLAKFRVFIKFQKEVPSYLEIPYNTVPNRISSAEGSLSLINSAVSMEHWLVTDGQTLGHSIYQTVCFAYLPLGKGPAYSGPIR